MRFLLVVFLLLFPTVTQADTMGGSHPSGEMLVKGDILYVEGEYLVVKELSGQEVRVHVNAETKMDGAAGRLKAGDKIVAAVTPEGHAISIALQIPGGGVASSPGSP